MTSKLQTMSWQSLTLKDKSIFLFFMCFALTWMGIAALISFKTNDWNTLSVLFIPFIIFGCLLNPNAFQSPENLFDSNMPRITRICFQLALFFLCTPMRQNSFE